MVVGVLEIRHLLLPTQKAEKNMIIVCLLELLLPIGMQRCNGKDKATSSPFRFVFPLYSACPSTHRLATVHAVVTGSTIIPGLGRTVRTSAETAGGAAEDVPVHWGRQRWRGSDDVEKDVQAIMANIIKQLN